MAFATGGSENYRILIEADGANALKVVKAIDQALKDTGKTAETASASTKKMGDSLKQVGSGAQVMSQAAKSAGDSLKNLIERAAGVNLNAAKGFAEISNSLKGLASSSDGAGVAIGRLSLSTSTLIGLSAGVVAVGVAFAGLGASALIASKALKEAGAIEGVTQGFKSLQDSIGKLSDDTLGRLRVASKGLLSDFELMTAANNAVILGLPIDGFDKATAAAIKLGQATGKTAVESIAALTEGLGRQSTEMLNNIGVILKVEEANQKYAAQIGKTVEALTDEERVRAFQIVGMQKIIEKASGVTEAVETGALAYQRYQAEVTNLTNEFYTNISSSESLRDAYNGLASAISQVDIKSLADAISGAAAIFVNTTTTVITLANAFTSLAGAVIGAFTAIASGKGVVSQQAANMEEQIKLVHDFGAALDALKEKAKAGGSFEANRAEMERLVKVFEQSGSALKDFSAEINSIKNELQTTGLKAGSVFTGVIPKVVDTTKSITKLREELTGHFKKDLPALRKGYEEIIKLQLAKKLTPDEAISKIAEFTAAAAKSNEEIAKAYSIYADMESAAKSALQKAQSEADKTKRKNEQLTKSIKDARLALSDVAKEILKVDRTGQKGLFEEIFLDFQRGALTAEQALQKVNDIGAKVDDITILKDLADDARAAAPVIKEATVEIERAYADAVKKIKDLKKKGIEPEFLPGAAKKELDVNDQDDLFSTSLGGSAGDFSKFVQEKLGVGKAAADAVSALGSGIIDGIGNLGTALKDGKIGKEETDQLVVGAATTVGAAIGAIWGMPEVGAAAGNFIGQMGVLVADLFDSEDAGTKARKSADAFFADIFDQNRLSVIIGDQVKQISDLVFQGDTLFGGQNIEFGQNAFDFLKTLPGDVQSAFTGVGTAFEQLLDIGEDVGGQLAAVFANNVGGSLNNLQLLVYSTGKSFEELKELVVEAFLNARISAKEAKVALDGLRQVMTKGIPDGVGRTIQAFQNLQVAGIKGGRASTDALRDIAFEANELSIRTLPDLLNNLVSTGEITADQVQILFQSLADNGISSLEQLASASDERLIGVLARLDDLGFAFKDPVNGAEKLADKFNELGDKEITLKVNTNVDANFNKVYELYQNNTTTAAAPKVAPATPVVAAATGNRPKLLAATSSDNPFDPTNLTGGYDFPTLIDDEITSVFTTSTGGKKKQDKKKPSATADDKIQEIRSELTKQLAGSDRVLQIQSQINRLDDGDKKGKAELEKQYVQLLNEGYSLLSKAETSEKKAEDLRKKKVVDLKQVLELENRAKEARAAFDKLLQASPTPISFDQLQELVTGSEKYAAILDQVNKKTINADDAQKLLIGTYNEAGKVLTDLNQAQERYDKVIASIARGQKVAAEDLTQVQIELYRAKKAYDEFGKSKEKTGADPLEGFFSPRPVQSLGDVVTALGDNGKLDEKAAARINDYIKGFTGDSNQLGVVLRSLGVSAEEAKNLIVDSFNKGQISALQAKKAMDDLGQALGEGIPAKMGATVDAFQNFLSSGLEGGAFTADALVDIFAEAAEKGITDLGTLQEDLRSSGKFTAESVAKLFETLHNNNINTLEDAKKITGESAIAIIAGFGTVNDATDATIKKASEAGVKTFDEFKTFLTNSKQFTQAQIDALFTSLSENGVNSFEQFTNLSDDLKNKILVDMDTAGNGFESTSAHIRDLIGEINNITRDIFLTIHVKTETDDTTDDLLSSVGEQDGVINNYITNITNVTNPEPSAPTGGSKPPKKQKPVGSEIKGVVGPPSYGRWKRQGPGQYIRVA